MRNEVKIRHKKSESVWWERYAVRYLVGAVVGFIVCVALAYTKMPELNAASVLGELSATLLITIAVIGMAAGVAYSYVASAPIMVLHAFRGIYKHGAVAPLLTIAVPIAYLIAINVYAPFMGAKLSCAYGWILIVYFFIGQIGLCFAACLKNSQLVDFQATSARAMAEAAVDPKASERTASDRSMREHGNAFFIILLNLFLGASIYYMEDITHVFAALLLWVAPAALVWFVATHFEVSFIREHGSS